MNKIESDPTSFVKISKMEGFKSYKLMELFIETVNDKKLQNKLAHAISGKNPFAKFRYQIDNAANFR
ncbi:MAG: UPF0158 family protein [Ferruginibacter sp.]